MAVKDVMEAVDKPSLHFGGEGSGNRPVPMSRPEEVIEFVRRHGLQIVDLKFNDLPGQWQHFSVPAAQLFHIQDISISLFGDGIGFDGSRIRGFQKSNESDIILVPDCTTAIVDPVCEVPTLSLVCDIFDPITREPYSRDPRYISKKAEAYLKTTGIADSSFWGPEVEFFIFDEGDSPVAPHDSLQDLRSEIILKMIQAGINVEAHHHKAATAGQCKIDMRFDAMTKMGDTLLLSKYIIKNVCKKYGKVATFMPKPLFTDNGSGMHVHSSLWKDGKPLFFDAKGYALTSEMCRWYIGGLLKHAASILAFGAPTTNSYKRLVPGCEAPVNLVYSARNRSAVARIPMVTANPNAKRVEFRAPDPSCNGYLTFAAMLMAGLDGIQNKIDPGQPMDKNTYDLTPEEAKGIRTVPGSLGEALDALEDNHDFLLKGDVFTRDVIDTWIEFKRREIDEVRLRPHPHEFYLYFDA